MYKCVRDTFEGEGDMEIRMQNKNKVLSMMAEEWSKYGSHLYPSVVINDFTFRGQLNPFNVFEAICASFEGISP